MPERSDESPFLRLEELTTAEFDELQRDRTLIVLPISPIEQHGPHLPLGTDGILAKGIARGLIQRLAVTRPDWTFVRAPWFPIGCYTLEMAGSVEIDQPAVRGVVASFGRSMARYGFGTIVVVNGHGGPGHGAALEEACREVSRQCGVRMIYPIGKVITELFEGRYFDRFAEQLGRDLSDDERWALSRDYHAGAIETSIVLHERPDLVKGDPGELPAIVSSKIGMMRYFWGDKVGEKPGYMGFPSRNSPELAEATEAVLCGEVAGIVERVMDGEDVQAEIVGEFYRNPLFRTRARPLARAMETSGRRLMRVGRGGRGSPAR